jgi:hypothetical protein
MCNYRHPVNFPPSSNTNYRACTPECSQSGAEFDTVQFVISLENESGQEFFLAENNGLVSFTDTSDQLPILFETYQEISAQLSQLRRKYPPSWWIYAVTQYEFETRRRQRQPSERDQ